MDDIMHNEERMKLINEAIDESKSSFDELYNKDWSDVRVAVAENRIRESFYDTVIKIAEMHF